MRVLNPGCRSAHPGYKAGRENDESHLVVPAHAGTHPPCPLFFAVRLMPSLPTYARVMGPRVRGDDERQVQLVARIEQSEIRESFATRHGGSRISLRSIRATTGGDDALCHKTFI